ncbi:hypothetical protein OHB14_36645 [Streptomyces sp. NBC_01613]|uniref:hypothetical protein n=1 Tax=Streptomyces sp. NBC_01613 TaxID=2975896 RepID=UPI00386F8560
MSETVQQLTSQQVADLRRQLRERDEQLAMLGPTEMPTAPLPRCPDCGAEAERIDQRVEDPEFGVDETALRLRWRPCGHRFRAVVDPSAGLVRPDEEPT